MSATAALHSSPSPLSSTAALATYDDAIRSSFIWRDLHQVRDVRHVFGRGFFVGAACAGAMTLSKGRISLGKLRTRPDADHTLLHTDRHDGWIDVIPAHSGATPAPLALRGPAKLRARLGEIEALR